MRDTSTGSFGQRRVVMVINSTGEGFDLDMTLRPPQEEPLTGHVHLGRWIIDTFPFRHSLCSSVLPSKVSFKETEAHSFPSLLKALGM